MFRPATRALRTLPTRQPLLRNLQPQRNLTTAPPARRPRSWRSSAARWGLAAAGIYFYNTSELFQEETTAYKQLLEHQVEDDILPTLESVAAHRREVQRSRQAQAALAAPATHSSALDTPPPQPTSMSRSSPVTSTSPITETSTSLAAPTLAGPAETSPVSGSPTEPASALEEEAESEGAFNEETGEINWDCPCLGGMAHGPCGMQFREAFSCFVYSKDEPKGIDCIDKFKIMQDCFREHPDIYGAELSDDPDVEDEDGAHASARDATMEDSEALSLGAEPTSATSAATTRATPAAATNATKTSTKSPSSTKPPAASSKSTATPPPSHSSPSSSSSTPSSSTSPTHSLTDTLTSAAHTASTTVSSAAHTVSDKLSQAGHALQEGQEKITARVKSATEQVRRDHGGMDDESLRERGESDELVPKAWHDARGDGKSDGPPGKGEGGW